MRVLARTLSPLSLKTNIGRTEDVLCAGRSASYASTQLVLALSFEESLSL